MAAISDTQEDPLIAALPPATDYITYLTLLEYQLTPRNLPTLNRLLSEDDGTLASEIGWDLLKLVLPMIQVVPEDANKCLEIIARRGNPREVVVRVAEELERLGKHDDDESEGEEEDDQDELPTFAGEATRVHLGKMTLDGMPPSQSAQEERPDMSSFETESNSHSGSDDGLSLQALLAMLGILHPRIKTQYPSRFLATSLPAALSAYRRLPITTDTTTAFLDFLGRLAGKQRPALPPRTSTAGSSATLTLTQVTTAPLPDPEAQSESVDSKSTRVPSITEKAIINKLLQAVTLEVLDEFTRSLVDSDHPRMSLTTQLRQRGASQDLFGFESIQTPPGEHVWVDNLFKKFKSRCDEVAVPASLSLLVGAEEGPAPEIDDEQNTDYPNSPSDIELPAAGLIELQAIRQFYSTASKTGPIAEIVPLPSALALLKFTKPPQEPLHTQAIDALLSLIYTALTGPSVESEVSLSQPNLFTSLDLLTDLFTTNPDAQNRTNAHHISTKLLHDHADSQTKLTHIKSLLSPSKSQISAVHSIQSGNLAAIAIDWLKDEIRSGGLNLELLNKDTELVEGVFPELPAIPGPFISSQPQTRSATHMSTEVDLEDFLLQIPAYISALNLIFIVAGLTSSTHETSTEDPTYRFLTGPLLERVSTFVGILEGWRDGLLMLLAGATKGKETDTGPFNMGDIYALEDACARARTAVQEAQE